MHEKVLVIKHGALGDLVQSFDALAAVRCHHRESELVLMTATEHAKLARLLPWPDRLWLDDRPPVWKPMSWWAIRRRFVEEGFRIVYDLQCSRRTGRYFRLIPRARRPLWVGAARGCSHPNPDFSAGGFSNRQKMAAQLATAGVPTPAPADLSWFDADVRGFDLPPRILLLIPGCSPHLPGKRWPTAHYAALARRCASLGLTPVLVGTAMDRDAIDAIRGAVPDAIDLGGRTTLAELAGVARRAEIVVGNDTGPTFLSAAVGAPTLMLMSAHTDPSTSAPAGPCARWLKCDDLAGLTVETVLAALPVRHPSTEPPAQIHRRGMARPADRCQP
ncbi:MAG: glycosyltransferase family 9 protein [Acetobacteraceae bacterium]